MLQIPRSSLVKSKAVITSIVLTLERDGAVFIGGSLGDILLGLLEPEVGKEWSALFSENTTERGTQRRTVFLVTVGKRGRDGHGQEIHTVHESTLQGGVCQRRYHAPPIRSICVEL